MAHQGSKGSQHEDLQKAVISSAYSLMGLQLVSRLFTFALNQCLLRLASPQVFGTAAIQFELIFSTVLFLSREGVRHTVLRTPQSQGKGHADSRRATALFNLTSLPIIFGLPSTVLATYLYGRFASEETRYQALFNQAITIYAIAAMVELMTEPPHNQYVVTTCGCIVEYDQ
jgi:oligosaccharide translocation protein RFT1